MKSAQLIKKAAGKTGSFFNTFLFFCLKKRLIRA